MRWDEIVLVIFVYAPDLGILRFRIQWTEGRARFKMDTIWVGDPVSAPHMTQQKVVIWHIWILLEQPRKWLIDQSCMSGIHCVFFPHYA